MTNAIKVMKFSVTINCRLGIRKIMPLIERGWGRIENRGGLARVQENPTAEVSPEKS